MNITHLALLYALIGAGTVIALLARDGRAASPADLGLMFTLWPLYGPFSMIRDDPTPHLASAPTATNLHPGHATDLLDALRRAGGAPLAALLPDIETGRRLAARLDAATRRVDEIELLLQQPEYGEAAALERQHQLLRNGDTDSASLIEHRIQLIRRLGTMRDQGAREINQISELLTQLQLQAEVVRLAGQADDSTRDLLDELLSRVQSLELIMRDAGDFA